jgi:hypothetical protein
MAGWRLGGGWVAVNGGVEVAEAVGPGSPSRPSGTNSKQGSTLQFHAKIQSRRRTRKSHETQSSIRNYMPARTPYRPADVCQLRPTHAVGRHPGCFFLGWTDRLFRSQAIEGETKARRPRGATSGTGTPEQDRRSRRANCESQTRRVVTTHLRTKDATLA